MGKFNSNSLEELKIQASIFLKSLKSTDPVQIQLALTRLQILPLFVDVPIIKLMEMRLDIKHKHALEVIALENQFESWRALKVAADSVYTNSGMLHLWFAQYQDALNYLKSNGGYLLPYKNNFFIADEEYIAFIGFDPKDPDWKKIGWDWVKPLDTQAWKNLKNKKRNR